jgi:hypothetical protein
MSGHSRFTPQGTEKDFQRLTTDQNPRVFAKTTSFSQDDKLFAPPSKVSSALVVWSTQVRAAAALEWHARSFQRRAWLSTKTRRPRPSPSLRDVPPGIPRQPHRLYSKCKQDSHEKARRGTKKNSCDFSRLLVATVFSLSTLLLK